MNISLIHFNLYLQTKLFYSFKCGTDTFMCNGLKQEQVCSNSGTDNSGDYISAADCTSMIAATKTSHPYGSKCPNGQGISHYVIYNCKDTYGSKFEQGSTGEKCSCPSGVCGPTTRCGE